MLISSIALQVYCVAQLWRKITLAPSKWYLLGGIRTLPAGIYLLYALDAAAYSIVVGGVSAIYGRRHILKTGSRATLERPSRRLHRWGHRRHIPGRWWLFLGAAVRHLCAARVDGTKSRNAGVYQPYISHHADSDTCRTGHACERPNRST
jgi:hypothetical protein